MNVDFINFKTHVQVWVNSHKLGELKTEVGGEWVFYPELEKSNGGYWPAWVLRQIADWIDQKNEAWEKELDIYFSQGVDKDKKV